jgi:hypothetical protein
MVESIDKLPEKARALANLMVELCEEHYSTEWMQMTAYWLWEELTEQDRITQTANKISPEEINQLQKLSQDCGGWVMEDETNEGLVFVTLDEWKKIAI